MALLTSGYTALEAACEIVISDVTEGCDHLLLDDICHFHFACCGHARNYAARNMVSYVGQTFEIVLVRWVLKINGQHTASIEILFLADRPVATGLEMDRNA